VSADPKPPSLPLARLLGHAADAVQAVRGGQSLTDALARVPADARAGTQALAFHALRWLGGAQAVRKRLAPKTPPPAVDAVLTTALALLWPTEAPPPYAEHTLVDQAVTLVRQRAPAAAGFVNAVLRRFAREREALVAEAARADPVAAWQHPAWWIERLRRDWPQQWQDILRAAHRPPPMTLRVNARRSMPAAYVERLATLGIAARVVGPQAVVLAEPRPVAQLPGFSDGEVSVQDAAAQLAAPLLLHAAPRRVLDACAAPGGKTAHLLELADLDVLALDADALRLARVHDNLQRLGLAAQLQVGDARRPEAWWDGRPFDAILLDAPCSASGIVRRHPDVRWLRRASDIGALVQVQAQLLDALWPLLRPGGRLLYATCSVFKAEGVDQIDAFLQRQAGARWADAPASPGHLLPLPDNRATEGGVSMDGFYYALLERH
jgi:16S rRNA (cytosine967-C5)-methyltransferase